jgi:hypothetical protein
MDIKLETDQSILLQTWWWRRSIKSRDVTEDFTEKFHGVQPQTRPAVLNLSKRFAETGSNAKLR